MLGNADGDGSREALADVVEEADRVSSLLTTLMDISEAETGVMRLDRTAVDVAAVAAETVELYEDVAEQKGVTLSSEVPDGLLASADRPRLRQVLANIVDNAVKYTPSGGRVSITGRAAGDDVVIEVADTGIGVAPEHLQRIWDRLYRADGTGPERGLGLGLSLVKAVVEAHGGRAEVSSVPRAGHDAHSRAASRQRHSHLTALQSLCSTACTSAPDLAPAVTIVRPCSSTTLCICSLPLAPRRSPARSTPSPEAARWSRFRPSWDSA